MLMHELLRDTAYKQDISGASGSKMVLKHQALLCLAHAVLTYPLDDSGKLMLCLSQQGLCVDGTLQTLCWKALPYSFPASLPEETHHSNGPAATAHHRLLRQVGSFPRLFVTGTAAGLLHSSGIHHILP